jgi:leucokinin receptor
MVLRLRRGLCVLSDGEVEGGRMNTSNNETEWYEPLYEPSTSLVVFLSLCYGSISVAAVIGNGLVIWVIISSRRMRNVTNYYIANLALADIVIALFAIPFEVSYPDSSPY